VNSERDKQYVRSSNLDATWSSFLDSDAGVYQYDYALVTANNMQLIPFASLNPGSPAASVVLENENMEHGNIFRFKTLARNFASTEASILSNQIIVDLQPPQCRSIILPSISPPPPHLLIFEYFGQMHGSEARDHVYDFSLGTGPL